MISLAAITTCPPTSRMVRSLRVRVTYRMLLVFTAWMASVSIMSSFSISYLVDIFISSLYLVDACNISRQSSLPTSRSCLVELPDFPINRSLRVHIHREFFFFSSFTTQIPFIVLSCSSHSDLHVYIPDFIVSHVHWYQSIRFRWFRL